jgi:hypothetical protein
MFTFSPIHTMYKLKCALGYLLYSIHTRDLMEQSTTRIITVFISVCGKCMNKWSTMNLRLLLSFKLLMNWTFLQVTIIYVMKGRDK